jgi:hypothetical protein
MELTCKDCLYYLPVDVFKGICKATKENITPETPFCGNAEKVAKCKFCKHFVPEKEFTGKCMGALAYPDMIAVKCEDFEWYRMN